MSERAPPVRQPWGLRRVRLASGLVLFTYVLTHLLNHALGNISIGAMEAGLALQEWLWQGVLGTAALYTALAVHFALGHWALYQRRHWGWTPAEVWQLLLGLLIPPLLVNHAVVTRLCRTLYGVQKGYAQELYAFWVASPLWGTIQVALLLVAWTHGCLGLYFWLRLKPVFARLGPALPALALLVPVLALLGFYQGGRTILALAQDPAWRALNLAPAVNGTPAEAAALAAVRVHLLAAEAALIAAIMAARLLRVLHERRRRTIRLAYPNGRIVRVPLGFSVLEASLLARVPHACVCGGRARCSTCRIRVSGAAARLPPPSPVEAAVLRRVAAAPSVRLACQLRPAGDVSVVPLLPPDISAAELRRHTRPRAGEERVIAVMVVDMRDSTRLATERLPFDAVFVIDRFIEAVGAGITEAGGRPNQFRGDGLLAMFGVDGGPAEACRQALGAAILVARRVEALNAVLAHEMAHPIRYGIGIHGGPAIVGEIGYGKSRVFTALGDTANIAARLEGLCRPLDAEIVLSDELCRLAGLELAALPVRLAELRGRAEPFPVRLVARAGDLEGVLEGVLAGVLAG